MVGPIGGLANRTTITRDFASTAFVRARLITSRIRTSWCFQISHCKEMNKTKKHGSNLRRTNTQATQLFFPAAPSGRSAKRCFCVPDGSKDARKSRISMLGPQKINDIWKKRYQISICFGHADMITLTEKNPNLKEEQYQGGLKEEVSLSHLQIFTMHSCKVTTNMMTIIAEKPFFFFFFFFFCSAHSCKLD